MRHLFAILLALLLPISAQAAIFFDDSFEGVNPEAGGWDYGAGWCRPAGGSTQHPCFELDQTTEFATHGSKSMKGVYNAAWFDPNPQTHEQAMSHSIPASQNVYTRRYERQVGFNPITISGSKVLYYKNTAGRSPSTFSAYMFGGVHYPGTVGSRELSFSVQGIKTTCPPGTTGGAGATQEYQTCNFYPNMAAVPILNDQWYCIEEHLNYGTPGVANGSLEIWVNGTQTMGYYNQMFLGATDQVTNAGTLNGPSSVMDVVQLFKQGGKGNGTANGFIYWDQLAAGNQRIGCTGTPPEPTPDTTPPSAPTGMSNTAQTASSLTFALTAGIDSVSANLILNTERCTVTSGTSCTSFSVVTQTGVTGGAIVSYVSSPLAASTRYCFRWRMQDEVGNLSPYTASTCATTTAASVVQTRRTLATIPFTLSNEDPLSNGSTFDGGYTGFGNLKVEGNAVQASVLGTAGLMSYNGETSLGDSWCQFTVTTFTGTVATEQGCALQMADPPTASLNLCKALLNSANKTEIDLYTAGVKSVLGSEAAITWSNGDVGRCEKQGSAISFYRNDVLVISGTDATRTSGRVGLYAYVATGGGGSGSLTFDSANSTSSSTGPISSLTWNHTMGAGSNGELNVCVAARGFSPGPPAISGVTFNGDAMTLVRNTTADWGGGYSTEAQAALYRLVNPDVGTYPVVVSFSSSASREAAAGSVSYLGVDQTTPVEASNGSSATSSTASVSVTTLTNNAVVMDCLLGKPNPPGTPNGSQTTRMNVTVTDDVAASSTIVKATAGAQSMSWTLSTSDQYVLSAMAIKPAGGDAGQLTQNVIDTLVLGDWESTPQPVVLDALCNLTPSPGCTLTYGATTPSYVRVVTGSNLGTPATTNIVYPLADIVAGRYTPPGGSWPVGFNFICFYAQDANHTESTNPNDYQCRTITSLTQTDVTPPALTVGAPNGQTITTSTAVLAITSDEFATVKFGDTDVAYDDLTLGQMDTVDGFHHSVTVSGLSNGSHTYYFCGRDLATPVQNACAVRSSMTFTVNTGGADTTPPTAPSALSCTAISSSQAPCTFEASTDAVGVTGYRATIGISNGGVCTPTTIINPGWSTATTQILIGLQPSTTYCLVNQGLDAAGNASAASNVATFTTFEQVNPIPPDKVLNVHLIPGSLKWNELGIAWDASMTSVVPSYQVFRCQVGYSCPNYTVRAIVPALSFTDGDVLPATSYRYLLFGSGMAGISPTPSDVLELTTPKIPNGATVGVCPCEGVNQ